MTNDTIAAIATPAGQGGVGIIRISGPLCEKIALSLLGELPKPRFAHFCKFKNANGETLDHGLALFFPNPNSFTGEDVLELQGHGGPIILDRVLKAILTSGARLAEPGEFSKRAFLNNKIDLAQAEAIADLIASQSEQAAQAAIRSLEGEFSRHVHSIENGLIALRMYVEAAIDFPEEEIDFLSDGHILGQLDALIADIENLQRRAQQGSILREGMTIVITGQPNAGKSSLLNALSGEDTAIVTDIPGTTRDVLKEKILIDSIPIHILDTAGIRDSQDLVEQEGIRRAKAAIQKAEAVLLVIDANIVTYENIQQQLDEIGQLIPHNIPIILVWNKIDLLSVETLENKIQNCNLPEKIISLKLSAKAQTGLTNLQQELKKLAGAQTHTEGSYLARRRHLQAIAIAYQHCLQAREQLVEFRAGELCAEELRQAQLALSEITGAFTPDDLLGKIFSSFCIGK